MGKFLYDVNLRLRNKYCDSCFHRLIFGDYVKIPAASIGENELLEAIYGIQIVVRISHLPHDMAPTSRIRINDHSEVSIECPDKTPYHMKTPVFVTVDMTQKMYHGMKMGNFVPFDEGPLFEALREIRKTPYMAVCVYFHMYFVE